MDQYKLALHFWQQYDLNHILMSHQKQLKNLKIYYSINKFILSLSSDIRIVNWHKGG